MGTKNYGKSKYISIGLKPTSVYDFEKDTALMEELTAECEEFGGNIEEKIETYIEDTINLIFEETEEIVNKYIFNFFDIRIIPGHYDGFYLDISLKNEDYFDGYEEKQAAQKETTQLKKCLLDCVSAGLVEYSPGWCTGYNSPAETEKSICEAIKKIREELKEIPTYNNWR